jgi:hypothetical protein
MGTKYWGFIYVITWVGILAMTQNLSPEAATLISGLTGAFLGFQFGRKNGASNGSSPPTD